MSPARKHWRWLVAGLAAAVLGGAIVYRVTRPDPGDPRLNVFVHARPPVPVVFTSRTEPASLAAAAPEGEGFTYPGQRLWTAREGRLRLLTPAGTVRELTWGKTLPDGSTLIDVMSPSVSPDGKRILFAGRKGGDDAGRFRLYEIGVDGDGLRALTGGPDDEGCTDVPPMRWRANGSLIPDAERRATDYDDIDPIELNFTDRRIVFASSRTPDLGRDHARRSTTLWVLHADGRKHPATANRNNDRWPFLMTSGYIAFSLWSRNREVVTADLRDLRPVEAVTGSATRPTDMWLGAFTQMPGGHFGMLVKPPVPVWRPRPLFANHIIFMTTFAESGSYGEPPPLTVVQAPPGMLANVPSARSPDHPLPHSQGTTLRRGPDHDAAGRPLWLATPSPCPQSHVLLAGAPVATGARSPEAGAYGLYLARDDWPEGTQPADPAQIDLTLLFDDPEMVDAEPVAVYERKFTLHDSAPDKSSATPPAELPLANGQVFRGAMGQVFATGVDTPTRMADLPGQQTDTGEGPIFDASPPGAIDHLRIYAARRDRFDDPDKPRIPGAWELILKVPVKSGVAAAWLPTDSPTVLAGFDKAGQIVHWTTPAKDRDGRSAEFYAYAGDHYSLTRPSGKHFCVGCHPGHSGIPAASHNHAERLP
jgi:WD40-like Beta Propeller Repeat